MTGSQIKRQKKYRVKDERYGISEKKTEKIKQVGKHVILPKDCSTLVKIHTCTYFSQ